jgi:hypothetical protein
LPLLNAEDGFSDLREVPAADVKFETIVGGQYDPWTLTYNREDFWKLRQAQRRKYAPQVVCAAHSRRTRG